MQKSPTREAARTSVLAEVPVNREYWRPEARRKLAAVTLNDQHRLTTAPNRLLSVSEVADEVGLSDLAIRRAITRGELPAAKICSRIRVRRADIEAWITANRIGEASP